MDFCSNIIMVVIIICCRISDKIIGFLQYHRVYYNKFCLHLCITFCTLSAKTGLDGYLDGHLYVFLLFVYYMEINLNWIDEDVIRTKLQILKYTIRVYCFCFSQNCSVWNISERANHYHKKPWHYMNTTKQASGQRLVRGQAG